MAVAGNVHWVVTLAADSSGSDYYCGLKQEPGVTGALWLLLAVAARQLPAIVAFTP